MNEQLAWRNLTGKDEKLAQRALAALQARYVPALRSYLRNTRMLGSADCEDLIAKGFLKLWLARSRIACPNESAGRSYLFTIIGRCVVDAIREFARTRSVPVDSIQGTPDEPIARESTESQVYARVLAAQLLHAANCLWLGLDRSFQSATHTRQLMAAQFYYVENCLPEEILAILSDPAPCGEPQLTLPIIQGWINDPGVLRYLAYERLRYDSERLLKTILLLRKVTPELVSSLWQLARSSEPSDTAFAELSWAEVAVAIMRYQYSISYDEIAMARHDVVRNWDYSQERLISILECLRTRLPFCQDTQQLLDQLKSKLQLPEPVKPAVVLGAADLWQRMAFQYSYMMDVAQKDILERTQLPADMLGYSLSEHTLNSWISGRRLQRRLLQYWKETYGDTESA